MSNLTQLKQIVVDYVKDVNAESKKVVWPGKNYVIAATIIILVVIFVVAMLVICIDFGFAKLFGTLFHMRSR